MPWKELMDVFIVRKISNFYMNSADVQEVLREEDDALLWSKELEYSYFIVLQICNAKTQRHYEYVGDTGNPIRKNKVHKFERRKMKNNLRIEKQNQSTRILAEQHMQGN